MKILIKSATHESLAAWHARWGAEEVTDWADRSAEELPRRDVMVHILTADLDVIYGAVKDLTRELWRESGTVPKAELPLIQFQEAFFPTSETRILPGRQLRGLFARELASMHDKADAASCSPGGMLRELNEAAAKDRETTAS